MKATYLSTNGDTTTILPYPLEVHEYGCGLIEFNGKIKDTNNNDNLYLCCNIVEESFIGNIKMPVLRCIKRKNGFIKENIQHIISLKVI